MNKGTNCKGSDRFLVQSAVNITLDLDTQSEMFVNMADPSLWCNTLLKLNGVHELCINTRMLFMCDTQRMCL